jgi:hypothetical protein
MQRNGLSEELIQGMVVQIIALRRVGKIACNDVTCQGNDRAILPTRSNPSDS